MIFRWKKTGGLDKSIEDATRELKKQQDISTERRLIKEAEEVKALAIKRESEARATVLVITATDDRGEVDIRWKFAKAPPEEMIPTIHIFKSRGEALGDYSHAKEKGMLIVNTSEAGQLQDAETKKTGGNFYYTGYVFIDGIDKHVTHAVTHIKIDSHLYRRMERVELETKVATAEAKMHDIKSVNIQNQTAYIQTEEKLMDLEEETGIIARDPKEREKQVYRKNTNKAKIEAQKSKNKAIGVYMDETAEAIMKEAEDTKEATDKFKQKILDTKKNVKDESGRFDRYEKFLNSMSVFPSLINVGLREIVEEIDPAFKEASAEVDYEALENKEE